MHYDVISNAMLWFLHHGLFDLPRRPRFDQHFRDAWDGYVAVNAAFAEAHRRRRQGRRAGTGARLPARPRARHGAGGAPRPADRALHPHAVLRPQLDPGAARRRGRGAVHVHGGGTERVPHRAVGTRPTRHRRPRCSAKPRDGAVRSAARPRPGRARRAGRVATRPATPRAELDEIVGDRQLVLRSDRIDLSKNIVRGFLAYDRFLDTHPEWRERVVFVAMLNRVPREPGRVPRLRAGGRAGRGAGERALGAPATGSRSWLDTRDDYARRPSPGFARSTCSW